MLWPPVDHLMTFYLQQKPWLYVGWTIMPVKSVIVVYTCDISRLKVGFCHEHLRTPVQLTLCSRRCCWLYAGSSPGLRVAFFNNVSKSSYTIENTCIKTKPNMVDNITCSPDSSYNRVKKRSFQKHGIINFVPVSDLIILNQHQHSIQALHFTILQLLVNW